MKITFALLSTLVIAVLMTAEVVASSVGGGIYVPVKAVRGSSDCPTGNCRSGSTCGHCAKLGFACVDRATEAPCTAEGGCYPYRPTFGHYNQKWRTWPGEVDPTAQNQSPQDEGSLLKPYDAPPAAEEDQQAPPPIEDSIDESGDEIPSVIPSVEIELPPLPRTVPERPAPEQRPAPNFGQPRPAAGPPAPPFGLLNPSESEKKEASQQVTYDKGNSIPQLAAVPKHYAHPAGYNVSASEVTTQELPTVIPTANGPVSKAVKKVNHVRSERVVKKNNPPALPTGFTQTDYQRDINPMVRRLPAAPRHRLDSSVQPVAAYK